MISRPSDVHSGSMNRGSAMRLAMRRRDSLPHRSRIAPPSARTTRTHPSPVRRKGLIDHIDERALHLPRQRVDPRRETRDDLRRGCRTGRERTRELMTVRSPRAVEILRGILLAPTAAMREKETHRTHVAVARTPVLQAMPRRSRSTRPPAECILVRLPTSRRDNPP